MNATVFLPPRPGLPVRTGASIRTGFAVMALLVLLAIGAAMLPDRPMFGDTGTYAALHTGLELLAILFALGLFSAGWQAPRESRSLSFAIVAGGYLVVAVVGFAHTFTFPGMPGAPESALTTGVHGAYARIVAAVALLAAAFECAVPLRRNVGHGPILAVAAIAALGAGLVASAPELSSSVFYAHDGTGRSHAFGGYVLAILYVVAGVAFAQQAPSRHAVWPTWFSAGAFALAFSEVFLSVPVVLSGFAHVAGHIFKVIGFGFIAWAVHGRAIREPAAKLAANEERFRRLLRLTSDWYWEQDANGRFTLMEDDNRDRAGLDPGEYIGRTRRELLADQVVHFDWDAYEATLARHDPFQDLVLEIHPRDASEPKFLSVSGEPVFDADSVFVGYRGTGRDLTRQIAAEHKLRADGERLRASESRFRATFHANPCAMAITDRETDALVDVNAAFERLHGVTRSQALGQEGLDLGLWLDPADRERSSAVLREHGRVEAYPCQLRGGDGKPVDVLIYAEIIEIGGRPMTLAQVIDITQLRAAERKITENEQWLRAVTRRGPVPLAVLDLETRRFVEVNDMFTGLSGHAPDEVMGRTPAEIGLWAQPEAGDRIYAEVMEHGRLAGRFAALRTRSGAVREVLLFIEVLSRNGTRVLVVQGVDFTERNQAENRLAEVSTRLTLATRAARIGIWDLDLAHGRMLLDDTALELLGIERANFNDGVMEWTRIIHPEDVGRAREQFATVSRGRGDFLLQTRILRPDGGVRHVTANARVERDVKGDPERLVGTVHDVTEMTQARQALARVNAELEARVTDRTRELRETIRELESFSYTVAHDLRAPLRAIDGYSRFLEESLESGDAEAVATYFTKIRRNVGGMDRLIDGLLGYARLGRQALARGSIDMKRIVDEVVAAAKDQFPDTRFEVGALPPGRGDAMMLRQVWENLVGNACKFSREAESPVIQIGAEDGPDGPSYFVRDNGVGFDMRHAGKLFQVFERLHVDPRYPGTGIGLATVQRIVHRHGGHAAAEGRPGEGATFRFRIA